MLEQSINTLRFLQQYGESLLGDIAEQDFEKQPAGEMNSPAWIVGHMAYALDRHAGLLGAEHQLADWKELFAKGSTIHGDHPPYPHRDNLIAAWCEAINRLIEAVESASDDELSAPNEYLPNDDLPTLGDFLTYSMTGHFATHLGQLSAWRRAMGRPPLF